MILVDVHLDPLRGINPAVRIDKCKSLQDKKPLHLRLVCLQVRGIAQVILCHQFKSGMDDVYFILHVFSHDLLTPTGQLIQIQQADRAHGRFRIGFCAASYPDCSEHQDQHQRDPADQRYLGDSVLPTIHNYSAPCKSR